MAISTRNIPNLYSPTGDPTLVCGGILYIPDPAIHPGPYHCMCGTSTPGFKGDGNVGQYAKIFGTQGAGGFAQEGVLCLAFTARTLDVIPGQTTTGVWPQQTDDCKQVIQMLRPGAWIETEMGFEVTGFVGMIGPSAAAGHAIFCAVTGTAGVDQSDASIGCSPDTNYADRSDRAQMGGFINLCANYADLPNTDLVGLRAKSTVNFVTPARAALIKPVFDFNGDDENMPFTQLNGPDGLTANMTLAGITDPNKYGWRLNTGPIGRQHAFAMWDAVRVEAIAWMLARMAEFSGNEPPPPPEETGRERITALITGLAPDQELIFNVKPKAISSGLEGPVSSFPFISDRADTGGAGKAIGTGVFAKVEAVNGIITGNIATRAWLDFAYVDGGVFETPWDVINPGSRGSYDWTQPDAFLAALLAKDKQGGLAVDMGIKTPAWMYAGSHRSASFVVHGPNSGTIPIIWDLNYLNNVKFFIKDFGIKFDAHPNLNYVIVSGLGGQILDTLMVQDSLDYTNLNALAVTAGFPNLLAAWTQSAGTILDTWAKSMKQTRVYLAINLPVPSVNGGLTGIDEFTRASISTLKSRLGVMTLMLDGLTSNSPDLSLNKIIHDARQSAKAYRFLWPSTNPNCDPSQDPGSYVALTGLNNAAQAGSAIGAQMEEFYESDILTVSGGYPAAFATIHTALLANAV